MKTYKIGDFCKNLGVSPDFLKYQEEYGIIQPIFRDDSDYRYYHLAHAGKIHEALQYKSLGFSSPEIRQLVSEKTSEEIGEMLVDKAFEIETQILRMQYSQAYIQKIQSCMKCEARINPWLVGDVGGYYFLPHYHQNGFSDERTNALVREWKAWPPMVHSAQRILCNPYSNQLCVGEKSDYYWGVFAEEKLVREIGLPSCDPVIYSPPRRSLVYYQSIVQPVHSEHSWRDMLQILFRAPAEIMRQCGFKALGEIYNVAIFYSYEGKEQHTHTQLIIPLES